ncbi:hypothetical protein HPB50_008364 [Hyalomma asiaticum]|uniref:Uncharacterized protein n=1 Tax=Hyalomma asiaticum TaxID=266040 RepID=A0ACB7TJ67_HYAAI|nr:hypothetical protein HPB50_008364 [Hyalomma asiaticum]
MVVSVEGEDIDRDDFTNDAGWCEVRRRNTKKTSEGAAGPTRPMPRDAAAPTRASGNSKWQGGRTIRQIIKASRLPHLPAEDYKVIRRWERRRRDTEADALDSVTNHNNRTGEKGKDTSVSEGQRPEGSPLGQRGRGLGRETAQEPDRDPGQGRHRDPRGERREQEHRHPTKAGINLDTPPATKESTPIQATPTPAPTPVPAAPRGQTQTHKRKAKENADEQSGSTLEEVKGMFQEMFISLQQQFVQMHADLQQQVMQMRIEVSQRFDTLDGRVVQLENAPKDARPAGARPVKSKPYDRPPAAENSCKENASSQNGAA